MNDYKLTIRNISTDPAQLAQGILDRHGENFDAARGDFTAAVTPNGTTVEIVARDVTKGDMRILVEDIYRDFGDEDDTLLIAASNGDAASERWYSTELDDDDA